MYLLTVGVSRADGLSVEASEPRRLASAVIPGLTSAHSSMLLRLRRFGGGLPAVRLARRESKVPFDWLQQTDASNFSGEGWLVILRR